MKKTTTARLTAALAATALFATACGSNGGGSGDGTSPAGDGAAESYSIGIAQYVSHPALDAAKDGFKSAFADAGVEVDWDEQNAQADAGTVTSIVGSFATADLDLVAAIATPAAQGATQAITDKPVVFMAVTDPVDAKIIADWDAPGGNVTGVSDMNPVKEQLDLLNKLGVDAKTVGIVYSSGEPNSAVQVKQAEEAAGELGMEIKKTTITNSSEVQQGVQALGDVDAIYVPTDNAVVSALESVISYGESKQIPVIAAEGDSVARGAVATFGIDYTAHGKQAGEMAVKILTDGGDPASMPAERAPEESLKLYVNEEAAEKMGVTIPEDMLAEAEKMTAEDAEESEG